jgi:hypothetical protein
LIEWIRWDAKGYELSKLLRHWNSKFGLALRGAELASKPSMNVLLSDHIPLQPEVLAAFKDLK